jgi:hypothetical protein
MADDLRDRIAAKIRQPILFGLDDSCGAERAGEWADHILDWVMEEVGPEVERLRTDLAEMTACRDNALRQAAHANQSIHVDLEGDITDAIAAMDWEWPSTGDNSPPEELVTTIVATVRPIVAHAVKRAEQAEAEVARLSDFGLKERERHEAERDALKAALALHTGCCTDISIGDLLRIADGDHRPLDHPTDTTGETP